MSSSGEEKSRHIISATTLHPHRQTIWTRALSGNNPSPWLLFFHAKGVRTPLLFPIRETCSVWLFFLFFFFLSDDTTRTKKVSWWCKGGPSLPPSPWQRDGCHKWQAFVLVKYTHMLAFARAKGGGQGEQLVHLFRLVEQTMAVSGTLLHFQVCFALSCWYKLSCSLFRNNQHRSKYTLPTI